MISTDSRKNDFWAVNPEIVFLNHGSFGACPRPVLDYQALLRERIERDPDRFFRRDLEALLDAALARLAGFVGCAASDLAFVSNATTGANSVLRALTFERGDEILITDHGYNAIGNAARYAASRAGAVVVTAPIPFPIRDPDAAAHAVLDAVTPRTRLAVLDHVTSPTAIRLPLEQLVAELDERGIDTLVDGAHAPGMLGLDLERLGAAYYTGNCHKWLCAPKGSGFLHVRRDRQARVRPLSISHGANSARTDRSRFRLEFGWTGTADPTPWLAVPVAIDCIASTSGGWEAHHAANRARAVRAREIIGAALGIPPPCPESMLGSMAALPLAAGKPHAGPVDPLQDALLERFRVVVPIIAWPRPGARLLRVSAQAYNTAQDFHRLAAALVALLGPVH